MGEIFDQLKLKKKELNEYRQSVGKLEDEIAKLTKKLIAEDVSEKINKYEIQKLEYPNGLNRLFIRDFLCYEKNADFIGLSDSKLLILGSGPWKKLELEEFLSSKYFECVSVEMNPSILILGDFDFDNEEIDRILFSESYLNKNLRIYTQELFVYYLITGEDPLENWEVDTLLTAVEDHKGLQYILNFPEFTWPISSSDLESIDYSISEIDPSDWDEESPLRKLGYTVKEGALSEQQRHNLLTRAFSEPLDEYLNSSHEKERWGKANSAQRLYAIASFISWLNGFQGSNKPGASERWRNDLQWLKEEFYLRRMKFEWPNPIVNVNSNNKTNSAKPTILNIPKTSTKVQLFRVGKKVFNEKYGWGKVSSISTLRDEIEVDFSDFKVGTRIFSRSLAKFYE